MLKTCQFFTNRGIAGGEVYPGRRPFYLWDASADDVPHPVRSFERLEQKKAFPYLERCMGIRTDRSRNVLLFGKSTCGAVESGKHAARVIDFDRVYQRQDFKQVALLPRPGTQPVKRMRYADECSLFFQTTERLLR